MIDMELHDGFMQLMIVMELKVSFIQLMIDTELQVDLLLLLFVSLFSCGLVREKCDLGGPCVPCLSAAWLWKTRNCFALLTRDQ